MWYSYDRPFHREYCATFDKYICSWLMCYDIYIQRNWFETTYKNKQHSDHLGCYAVSLD